MEGKSLPIFPNTQILKSANLIGKGYPAPNTKFRWCTERMKIRPSDRYLRKLASRGLTLRGYLLVTKLEKDQREKICKNYEFI